MMRYVLAFFLAASTAHAKDITLPLNDQEQTALREILNIATKAGGLEVARVTIHFDEKIKTYQLQADSIAAPPPRIAPPAPPAAPRVVTPPPAPAVVAPAPEADKPADPPPSR